jgi:hypothetical protein
VTKGVVRKIERLEAWKHSREIRRKRYVAETRVSLYNSIDANIAWGLTIELVLAEVKTANGEQDLPRSGPVGLGCGGSRLVLRVT